MAATVRVLRNFVGADWVESTGENVREIVSPVTGETLAEVPIVPVDRTVAARYGELRAATGRGATNDLWIAATALAHDFTLVTADGRQASLPLVRATLLS